MSVYQKNASWQILPPRPLLGKLKSINSAEVELNILADGVMELKIYHDLLKGISPAMLLWWFKHIGENMLVEGQSYPRYLIWHPIDHIHWQLAQSAPDGTIGQGSRFYIVEALGANRDYLVNSVETVTRLDLSGITLRSYALGQEYFSLSHDFVPESGGTRYISRMLVGLQSTFAKSLVNHLIRWQVFPVPMGQAWLKHNVEEVGNFENFLPQLWEESLVLREMA